MVDVAFGLEYLLLFGLGLEKGLASAAVAVAVAEFCGLEDGDFPPVLGYLCEDRDFDL